MTHTIIIPSTHILIKTEENPYTGEDTPIAYANNPILSDDVEMINDEIAECLKAGIEFEFAYE